jgi:hypothetical protein
MRSDYQRGYRIVIMMAVRRLEQAALEAHLLLP